MQTEQQNYGMVEKGGAVTTGAGDEKTWSVLAHLSMFLNLVTGFPGPVAALVVYLMYGDSSRKVAFQALQSMWCQIGWLVILVSGVPFVHAPYAAYRVSRGEDYRYPTVSDLIDAR